MRKWSTERGRSTRATFAARARSGQGMSLVEATIILMVLAILTSVVAPSVADYVGDARQVKAKEDVEALGMGIVRLLRDTGKPCLGVAGTTACTVANRVEILLSGPAGANLLGGTNADFDAAALGVTPAAQALTAGTASATPLNWAGAAANRPTPRGTFDMHLNENTPSYTAVSFTGGGGPRAGLGWRGAYTSGPVGLDPWGRRYQANTLFLGVATDAGGTTGEGEVEGGWSRDSLVLSPGANGLIETAFGSVAASAGGDDIIYVIKGATR